MASKFHKGTEFANVKETWEHNERNGSGEIMPRGSNNGRDNKADENEDWKKGKEETVSDENKNRSSE